jgi:hypothetical protein
MKIPGVNDFGNTVLPVAPRADTSAVNAAMINVGNTLTSIGNKFYDQDQAVARMRDSNEITKYGLALKDSADKIKEDLITRNVPAEQWNSEFKSRLSTVQKPVASARGKEAITAVQIGAEQTFGKMLVAASNVTQAARAIQSEQTLDDGLSLAAQEGDQAGADLATLKQRGTAYGDAAARAGVDQEAIGIRLRAFNTTLATIAARRDPAATLTALSAAPGKSGSAVFDQLSFEGRQVAIEKAKTALVNQQATAIVQTYANNGADAGTAALAGISQSNLPADLQDDVRAKVNGAVSQLRDQRRQQHSDDIANVETSIQTDTVSRDTLKQVHQLYQTGALTPSENASYTARIESSIIDRNRNAAASQAIVDALRSGLPLDPNNAEHRKAVTGAFANETTGMPLGSQQWQSTAIRLADHVRMLPDQASAWTRQAMRSPDSTIAANAAQFYGAVQTAAPDAASSFDEHTKAFAGMVNGMIEAGTDPKKAVEVARSNVFEQKPEITDQREKQYAAGGTKSFAANSDNALKQFIGKDFSASWFANNPVPTAGLSVDFNSQTQRYFTKVGDITLARKLAWDDLKHVYGESEVNGTKQIMAFAPEKFGVQPEDVRTDIDNFLKGNPQADGSGAADVYLVPDSMTLRAVGDALTGQNVRPSYKLVTKSGDLVIDRNGVPKRYTLPTGEELATHFKAMQAEATAQGQAIVNQSRTDRELLRKINAARLAAQEDAR